METTVMGRVLTEASFENLEDLWAAKRGLLPPEQARRITVTDALVDTGATLLSLPTRLIQQLGLKQTSTKRVTTFPGHKQWTDAYLAAFAICHGMEIVTFDTGFHSWRAFASNCCHQRLKLGGVAQTSLWTPR